MTMEQFQDLQDCAEKQAGVPSSDLGTTVAFINTVTSLCVAGQAENLESSPRVQKQAGGYFPCPVYRDINLPSEPV